MKNSNGWISYDFAVLRVVPHVATGAFVPVGVVMHARTAEFLTLRVITDEAELHRRVPDVDAPLLAKYLESCKSVCDGDEAAGPVALAPPSERFHWITAPRSDVIQCSPIHGGLCIDLAAEMNTLYQRYVG